MKSDPTVNKAEFTEVDTFADPEISRPALGLVLPIPTRLFKESTNKVPESKLTLPDMA